LVFTLGEVTQIGDLRTYQLARIMNNPFDLVSYQSSGGLRAQHTGAMGYEEAVICNRHAGALFHG
jgi:hypothetical protein